MVKSEAIVECLCVESGGSYLPVRFLWVRLVDLPVEDYRRAAYRIKAPPSLCLCRVSEDQ